MNRQSEMNRREIVLSAINLLGFRHSSLNPSVKQLMISCPFHKDKDPSFGINLEDGRCHCFSCGWKGSIESLFKDLTKQDLRTVLGINKDFSRLESYSFKMKKPSVFKYESKKLLKSVYVNLNEEDFIDAWMVDTCRAYLQKRGITEKVSYEMQMKYAEDTRINGTRFVRRLILPIYEQGRLIAVEGRRINPEDPNPKVLYAKNCTVDSLYDLDNLDSSKPIYAVEGLMDLAVLRSSDTFKNSTAVFGAEITNRQLQLIQNFSQFIYIYDLDAAGFRTVEKLKNNNQKKNIYTLKLPSVLNGVTIKDVGDLPTTGYTPEDLVRRRWLNHIRSLV